MNYGHLVVQVSDWLVLHGKILVFITTAIIATVAKVEIGSTL